MIKSRFTIFFLGLLFLINLTSNAITPVKLEETGVPLVQKFSFPDFCLSSGKFSVYEDSSGTFILGAKDKIIIFYGNEFYPLRLKGQINIISNQKSVFYTGENSIGIIKLYKNSIPQFIPIVDEKLKNDLNFGQINNVYLAGDLIVFNNNRNLYEFDDPESKLIDSSKKFTQLFRVSGTIIVNKYETGLGKLVDGKIIAFENCCDLQGKVIEAILPFNGYYLIKCADNPAFYNYDGKRVSITNFGFEDFIDKSGFADALMLPDNSMVIGTKSAGVLIYNFKTKTIRKIGINEGLLENSVNNLYLDNAGNLWILHDKGISRVELNIPVLEYSRYAGISGKINEIIKYNNSIYLATSNGLLKGSLNNITGTLGFQQLNFIPVQGIINECVSLQIDNNYLYAITPTGIYNVNGLNAELIDKENINCLIKSTKGEFYLIGNENGLKTIKFSNKAVIQISSDTNLNRGISEMSIESNGNLWIKTNNYNLTLVSGLNEKLLNLKFKNYFDSKNLSTVNFHLLKTYKGVRFCFSDSILKYDFKAEKFKQEEVSDLKNLKGIPWLVETQIDKFGNRWFQLSSSIIGLKGVLLYTPHSAESKSKPVFFNTGIDFATIYIDSSRIWIAGDNKLLMFDNKKSFNLPRNFSAIIKRIILKNDSVLKVGLVDPEINYRFNTLEFEVSSTCFESEPYIRYQYQLEGKDKNWTNWTHESVVKYNKLHAGKYIFKVRALNIDGTVSDETDLKFYILHPFYKTIPAYLIYILIILFLVFVFLRWRMWMFLKNKENLERIVQERTEEILKEKEKSEVLIANMLPKGTADELKSTGKATSQKFAMATVLFSDIQGFTKIAEQMNPDMLIDQLDAFFFHFDSVVEKYNIEKIKTIGDAYMCAGGIPNKNITNPVEVVLAALEVQEYMRDLKSRNADIWDLRIGIHTGSVIAGVVGHKKLSYDIWGDTVNTASRMESSGEAGKINISGHTYELVKEFFICEHRGKMPVKYKGEIDMYFVKGIRPELAIDMRHIPNNKFIIKLQLLRVQDLENEIFEKLTKELTSNYFFHNITNFRDIYNMVDVFGRAENLSDEETLILRTAALLHNIGLIWNYDTHEDYSINYTREELPKFKYTEEQIEKVVELIVATKRFRKPQNKLEEILLDAEMNYISRADFISLNESYYREMKLLGKAGTHDEWDNMQIVLLSNHKFYTNIANVLRDVSPEQQIDNIIEASKKTSPGELQ